MSAVVELEGDKKGSPKRRGDTGDRWQKPVVFQEICSKVDQEFLPVPSAWFL